MTAHRSVGYQVKPGLLHLAACYSFLRSVCLEGGPAKTKGKWDRKAQWQRPLICVACFCALLQRVGYFCASPYSICLSVVTCLLLFPSLFAAPKFHSRPSSVTERQFTSSVNNSP